jgi:fatty acid desaturase
MAAPGYVDDIPIAAKATLAASDGTAYREFRRTLTPRWSTVAFHLALAYAALAGVVAAIAAGDPHGLAAVLAAAAGALAIGYTIASINNFFHEAVHYNLRPGRRANDRVANVLMAWLFGSGIALYRAIHFQHHRALGTTMDSENSYFDPLRVRYLVEGLLGLKVLRTLRRYSQVEREPAHAGASTAAPLARRLGWMAVAAVVNGAIVTSLALTGHWPAAVAWAAGEVAVFPFFVSLRQTLEHRSEMADPGVDYRTVDHGAVNRLFGDGPVAGTLGSAGFNRHALHHWEPQVSYTRLRDLERWLMDTELAPAVAERQTTYRRTFLRLLEL